MTSNSNNLEQSLLQSKYIADKCNDENYAQNLYAALCNNYFIQLDTWKLLKGEPKWSCSWRYAGGIIADIIGKGDYLDWYCSGMTTHDWSLLIDEDTDPTTDPAINNRHIKFVSEGTITEEIKNDLLTLGWVNIN